LETCERVLGKEHPNTLISVNNLAGCMQAPGDAAGALSLYRRALEGCERVLGPEHPQTRTTAANLASLLANKDSSANEQPPKPEPPIWSLGPSHLSVSYAPTGLAYTIDPPARVEAAEPPPVPEVPPAARRGP